MHRYMFAIFAALLCLTMVVGCDGTEAATYNTLLPGTDGIAAVTVTSMPQGYDYSFIGESAKKIAQCILDMDVTADFPEDPNVYAGMTWVITAEYEDGNTATVYLFGNMFIRSGDGPWFKVSGEEAEGFEALLASLSQRSSQ